MDVEILSSWYRNVSCVLVFGGLLRMMFSFSSSGTFYYRLRCLYTSTAMRAHRGTFLSAEMITGRLFFLVFLPVACTV